MMGGFRKTASVHPGGVNPNDKTVMINPPPGRTWRGVNENFSPGHFWLVHSHVQFAGMANQEAPLEWVLAQ